MDLRTQVSDLMLLGLTHYEAKGYLGLVGRQQATPQEVARRTGLPRQRAYDVLASLAERGLVTPVAGPTVSYRARSPEHVIGELVAVRRTDLARTEGVGTDLISRLTPQFLEGQSMDSPLDYVEVVHDGAYAAERVDRLVQEAREEVLGMVRPPYLTLPATEDARVGQAPSQRGIYEASLLEDPAMVDLMLRFEQLGERVRIVEHLPLKLLIIDRRTVAFNLPDPALGVKTVTTLIVEHPMLAETLTIAFEAVWATATPLAERLPGAT